MPRLCESPSDPLELRDAGSGLAYLDTGGPGTPLVYLHGAGWLAESWLHQIRALPGHRQIAIDLPGHGRSADTPWRGMRDAIERVTALLEGVAGGKPVDLVGLSLGGDLVLDLIATRPELARSACVTGVIAVPPAQWIVRVQSAASFLVEWPSLHRLTLRGMNLDAATTARLIRGSSPLSRGEYRRIIKDVMRGRALTTLAACPVPTLVMAGSREPKDARRSAARLGQAMPNAVAGIAPGANHPWPASSPALFTSVLADWLSNRGALPAGLTPLD